MLDDLKEEGIVNKVGGRFKLSTLIQKRMVALNTGAKPLVDAHGGSDKMQIVLTEILEDKIFLDTAGNVQVNNATMMANIPGAYPGMPGMSAPEPGQARQATDD
jgi:DNA-directed RNA polymerase subunit omega